MERATPLKPSLAREQMLSMALSCSSPAAGGVRAHQGSHAVHMGARPSPRHSLSKRCLLSCSWQACNSIQQQRSCHPLVPLRYLQSAQDNKMQSPPDFTVMRRKGCMRKPHHATASCTEEVPADFLRNASAHAILQHIWDAQQPPQKGIVPGKAIPQLLWQVCPKHGHSKHQQVTSHSGVNLV